MTADCHAHQISDASLLNAAQSLPCRAQTVLPTAEMWVQGKGDLRVKARILFDSGFDRTYVSSSLVERVNLNVIGTTTSTVNHAAFGGGRSSHDNVKTVYSIEAKGTKRGSLLFYALGYQLYVFPCYTLKCQFLKYLLFLT